MDFLEIFNDIKFNGDKTTIIVKWVVGLAIAIIIGVYVLGEIKNKFINKIIAIEALTKENVRRNISIEVKLGEIKTEINNVNKSINGIYLEGAEIFNDYRNFNNNQLNLIIDYGQNNKTLLKEILKIKSDEMNINLKNDLNVNKHEKPNIQPTNNNDKSQLVYENESVRKYYVNDVPEDYVDTLKYIIINKTPSNKHNDLYNFEYKEK